MHRFVRHFSSDLKHAGKHNLLKKYTQSVHRDIERRLFRILSVNDICSRNTKLRFTRHGVDNLKPRATPMLVAPLDLFAADAVQRQTSNSTVTELSRLYHGYNLFKGKEREREKDIRHVPPKLVAAERRNIFHVGREVRKDRGRDSRTLQVWERNSARKVRKESLAARAVYRTILSHDTISDA